MATTTTINKNTVMVSQEAATFIRPMNVAVACTLLKPNTKMYAFFDGKDVNRYFQQSGKNLGDQMVSDANGALNATFNIPGMMFNTGERKLVISEVSTLPPGTVLSDNTGHAEATFTTIGSLEKWQTTENTITTIEEIVRVPVPTPRRTAAQRSDPLAQSFFTYGLDGGCYISSIDLYFQSKDSTAPVWIEIRKMSNGVPTNELVNEYSMVSLNASAVNISQDSSVATNFKFDKLIYLEPDKDYCFVVQARSTQYNMWTCKMSEKSLETGKTVFEQPYNGSMFKSENNFTWTAEQTEDIKFTLYKAKFNTALTANLNFPIKANNALVDGGRFTSIGGTNKCYVTLPYKHGLDLNSKIDLVVDTGGTYNGVSGTLLNGSFSIFEVTNEFIVGFVVPSATFNATGTIDTGGRVRSVYITAGGTGYSTTTPPTVSFGGPGSGAVASVKLDSTGAVSEIIITTQGTGYTTAPQVTITGAPGSGATAIAVIDSAFKVRTNRVYQGLNPAVSIQKPQSTDVVATMTTTLGQFPGGNNTSYTAGNSYNVSLTKFNRLDNNFLLASPTNETLNLGGANSANLNVLLTTTSENVSPIIDTADSRMFFIGNYINNQQTNETLTSLNSTAYLQSLTIQNGGAGYTSVPVVAIIGGGGSGATATAYIANGQVTNLVINSIGSGYTSTPTVVFYGGGFTTSATALATISDFNTERSVTGGSAMARYVSKQQQIASISTASRVIVEAYSNGSSSFEVYIRTSLSSTGANHVLAQWQLLSCDVSRNKSGQPGDIREYTFYKDGMSEFDVFSIKIVMRSLTPWDPPQIANYRAVIVV
jgi:hypothetical protein